MEILFIRHGLAGKPDAKRHPDDDERPLTPKGRKSFKRAAKGLAALDAEPRLILTSPALRTRETAELLARGLGIDAKAVRDLPELHHSIPPARALAKLARMRLPKSIALVGHEPWLGEFITLLIAGKAGAIAGKTQSVMEMGKGGGCLLDAAALKSGQARMRWLLTQDQLAAQA